MSATPRHRTFAPRLVHAACLLSCLPFGCERARADRATCQEIFDRIVEIELAELGYRDPMLVQHKQAELRRRLGETLTQCDGRRLPAGAMACVRAAQTAEVISHDCLR